jgi:cellulose synthase/poly-beta-1,6-N-acetylglucosamine synthase-like glycosyltransferase
MLAMIGWGVIINVWSALLTCQMLARRRGLLGLPPGDASDDSVCVIVPARNEADDLEACALSVLAQDHDRLALVIVEDRSTDATPAIARRLAGQDPRVTVRQVQGELPRGWMGKTHALCVGAHGADADWLLFIDADCRLSPQAVRAALAEAREHRLDVLTWWPEHRGGSFWEHMLVPLCGGIIAMWFGWQSVIKPRHTIFGNGQFLLFRRSAYERMGGHQVVRNALIEDVPLVSAAAAAGLSSRASCGSDYFSVRMYRSLGGIVNGWARIFVGALRSQIKLLLSVLWLALGSLLPFVVLPFARDLWLVMCVSHLLLMAVVSYRFWGMGQCDRRYLLLYPVSVVVTMGILLLAWWWLAVRRCVTWRGRSYRINESAHVLLSDEGV